MRLRYDTHVEIIRQSKITMIKTLKALMRKVDNMQAEMGNVSRDENSKKESKGNARNKIKAL